MIRPVVHYFEGLEGFTKGHDHSLCMQLGVNQSDLLPAKGEGDFGTHSKLRLTHLYFEGRNNGLLKVT